MQLNSLLIEAGIEPNEVLVLRHRPKEPQLRKVLPWLVVERPDLYDFYQRTQSPKVERAMMKADYVASFIGLEAGKALFIALYRKLGSNPLTHKQFWEIPEYSELRAHGMRGFVGDREFVHLFELEPKDFCAQWKGKLIIAWPGGERTWYRWADRNVFPIHAVLEQSPLDEDMPPWNLLSLEWADLGILPKRWRSALTEWRGIYFIFDSSDGSGYVGSAYGGDNILGRWENYAATGHGGNKELRKRDPNNFRFSILQRVSPDMDASDVIQLESSWKQRLHTREFGLNEN